MPDFVLQGEDEWFKNSCFKKPQYKQFVQARGPGCGPFKNSETRGSKSGSELHSLVDNSQFFALIGSHKQAITRQK